MWQEIHGNDFPFLSHFNFNQITSSDWQNWSDSDSLFNEHDKDPVIKKLF